MPFETDVSCIKRQREGKTSNLRIRSALKALGSLVLIYVCASTRDKHNEVLTPPTITPTKSTYEGQPLTSNTTQILWLYCGNLTTILENDTHNPTATPFLDKNNPKFLISTIGATILCSFPGLKVYADVLSLLRAKY